MHMDTKYRRIILFVYLFHFVRRLHIFVGYSRKEENQVHKFGRFSQPASNPEHGKPPRPPTGLDDQLTFDPHDGCYLDQLTIGPRLGCCLDDGLPYGCYSGQPTADLLGCFCCCLTEPNPTDVEYMQHLDQKSPF